MCFIRNDDGKRSIVGVGHTTKHTLCFFVSCFLETLIKKKDVSPRRCLDDNCLILFVESSFSTSHGYTMERVLYARCYACSVLCCAVCVYCCPYTVLSSYTIVCRSLRLAFSECHWMCECDWDDDFSESANTSTTQRSEPERIDTFCFVYNRSPQHSPLLRCNCVCIKCVQHCTLADDDDNGEGDMLTSLRLGWWATCINRSGYKLIMIEIRKWKISVGN